VAEDLKTLRAKLGELRRIDAILKRETLHPQERNEGDLIEQAQHVGISITSTASPEAPPEARPEASQSSWWGD
jgi:hypothetical protein